MKNITIAFVAAVALFSFAACKKKGGSGEAMDKMASFKDDMCKCTDKACADKVAADMAKWTTEQADKNKSAKATEEETKKSAEIGKAYADCLAKATGGGAGDKPPETADKPPEGAPAAGGDLPAECNDYKGMVEKLASCDKMPQQARDALKQSYDAASASWASIATLPPEAKKALADGCKQGADALKQAAAATCGW